MYRMSYFYVQGHNVTSDIVKNFKNFIPYYLRDYCNSYRVYVASFVFLEMSKFGPEKKRARWRLGEGWENFAKILFWPATTAIVFQIY